MDRIEYTGAYVTEHFFRILGVRPVLGRDFLPADRNRPLVHRGHTPIHH